MTTRTDYLVLGSGIAGLTFALRASAHGEVTIVTKRASDDSATNWAQGGVAAVLAEGDSFAKHAEDTRVAGAGLCHDVVVDLTVEEAPEAMRWLLDQGVPFTLDESGVLDLGREGGHSERRVAHAGDITGRGLGQHRKSSGVLEVAFDPIGHAREGCVRRFR